MGNILENIEALRKEKKLKQAVVAAELGVKQPAYSNYITRNNDIAFGKLSRIADILGEPVINIITYPKKYVDPETLFDSAIGLEEKVVLQIELKKEKKEQVMKLVFGEHNLEILNK